MIKSVFELLLIFHLLGDFYFQTEKMALEKAGKYRGVIKHSIIYVICFLGCMFVLFPNIPFHFFDYSRSSTCIYRFCEIYDM